MAVGKLNKSYHLGVQVKIDNKFTGIVLKDLVQIKLKDPFYGLSADHIIMGEDSRRSLKKGTQLEFPFI